MSTDLVLLLLAEAAALAVLALLTMPPQSAPPIGARERALTRGAVWGSWWPDTYTTREAGEGSRR